jgi:hypothetical protein
MCRPNCTPNDTPNDTPNFTDRRLADLLLALALGEPITREDGYAIALELMELRRARYSGPSLGTPNGPPSACGCARDRTGNVEPQKGQNVQ